MAFLENGSPVATKIGPIATLTTSIAGKATASEVYALTTSAQNLDTAFSTAGSYIFVTNTGTADIRIYGSDDLLFQQVSATTTSQTVTLSSAPVTWIAVGSGTVNLSITPVPATVATTNGNASLITFTSPGNFAASGGTYNYTAGEKAHVVVIGGGGSGRSGATYVPARAGGAGGVAFNNTAITLSGTYPITVGAGGAQTPSTNNTAGQAGSPSTGFGLTATGGAGGGNEPYPSNTGNATPGGPASSASSVNSNIFRPGSTNIYGGYGAAGNGGGPSGYPTAEVGYAGTQGAVIILKWQNT